MDLFVGSVVLMQFMLRSVQSLWVAYVVLVGIVGLVTVEGFGMWNMGCPTDNPCLPNARYPAICVFGQQCVNTGPGMHECVGLGYPWSESVHPNVKVWFDASDINGNGVPDVEEGYVPAGGLVNEWISRVGGISATAVGSAPSFDASTVGGKPSVRFDPVDSSHAMSTLPFSKGPDYAVFAVTWNIDSSSTTGADSSKWQCIIETSTSFYTQPGANFALTPFATGGGTDNGWNTKNTGGRSSILRPSCMAIHF
jgi:hypothetical protein